MTLPDTLGAHLQLCDELHLLALEENRFLKQHQRAPDAALIERRRALLARLEESLATLKSPAATAVPADPEQRARRAGVIEQSRGRLLQILHLQRENEQLVLRHSLTPPRPATPVAPPSASRLQKLYDQHNG